MGIISRFKGAQAYYKLEEEVRGEGLAIAQLSHELEQFEVLVKIWEIHLRRASRDLLALGAEHYVHPWAIVPNPHDALGLLAKHIGAYTIRDFHDLSFYIALSAAMRVLEVEIRSDDGANLNERFRERNPRSYAAFVAKHGRGPFTPPDTSVIEQFFQPR